MSAHNGAFLRDSSRIPEGFRKELKCFSVTFKRNGHETVNQSGLTMVPSAGRIGTSIWVLNREKRLYHAMRMLEYLRIGISV